MSLPTELISQFVKVTNDSKKQKVDTTVFGTAVEHNGGIYVKLDGAENVYTPVTTTADIHVGERVIVTIKNHEAIITGNISSPAVTLQTGIDNGDSTTIKLSDLGAIVADKANATDLEAGQEKVENQINSTSTMFSNKLEEQKADYESFITKFSKYIRFMEDENGNPTDTAMTIGSGDSIYTLEIDNDKGLIFKKNGVRFGLWDGVDFYTGNIIVEVNERAQFGNFAEVPRSDGSLSLLKVR